MPAEKILRRVGWSQARADRVRFWFVQRFRMDRCACNTSPTYLLATQMWTAEGLREEVHPRAGIGLQNQASDSNGWSEWFWGCYADFSGGSIIIRVLIFTIAPCGFSATSTSNLVSVFGFLVFKFTIYRVQKGFRRGVHQGFDFRATCTNIKYPLTKKKRWNQIIVCTAAIDQFGWLWEWWSTR